MAIGWSDEGDAAVKVLVVVPAHEGGHPATRGLEAGEQALGISGAILQSLEERLRERLSSLTRGRVKDAAIPSLRRVARIVAPFIGAPLS